MEYIIQLIVSVILLGASGYVLYRRYDELKKWAKDKPVLFIASSLVFVSVASCLILVLWYSKNSGLILPVVGVASFVIPIVLSFDDKYNLGTRLDNGEVRKSIAIALTVVYIIMLSIFFVTYLPYLGNVPVNQTHNNSSETSGSGLVNSNLILPLLIQPAAAQVSSSIATLEKGDNAIKKEKNATETEDPAIAEEPASEPTVAEGGNQDQTEGNDELKNGLNVSVNFPQGIPGSALGDIYKNFLYVYVLIIGFYFGSRVFEDFAGVRMTKELRGFDPEDLLKKRFAMGEISEEDYLTRFSHLKTPQEFAFFINGEKSLIRIENMSNKSISINAIRIDGITALEKNGGSLTTKRIGEKAHNDIEIKIVGLSVKDNYLIELTTDSGKVIKDTVAVTKLS